MKESIDCAAIRDRGTIYFLPRPNRHWKILNVLWGNGVKTKDGPDEQGFLTTTGRYVNRREGLEIAREAGQLIRESWQLHTEDLW